MTDVQLDELRENDRRLRAQIDPLIDGLSPLGKVELAMRLAGEAMLAPVRRRTQPTSIPAIRYVRVIEAGKERGESEEAPQGTAPLDDDHTRAAGA